MDLEEELITRVVWYYYMENRTQQNIAEILGISRMRVVRLLEKGQETGVIQFRVRADNAGKLQVEKRLMERYGLKDALVVPTPASAGLGETNDAIAAAAAAYLNMRITGNAFINIGYGDTAGKTLNNLAKMAETPVSFISLTGGVSIYLPNTRSSVFNARLFLIPAPLVVSSREMVDAIREERPVREIFGMSSRASFTLVGIGGMNPGATILQSGFLSQSDFLSLQMQGAVGDILCHFINREGKVIPNALEERVVSTPLEALRDFPRVIGVAAGAEKREAIRGALALGYITILITNEDTARWLLEQT